MHFTEEVKLLIRQLLDSGTVLHDMSILNSKISHVQHDKKSPPYYQSSYVKSYMVLKNSALLIFNMVLIFYSQKLLIFFNIETV